MKTIDQNETVQLRSDNGHLLGVVDRVRGMLVLGRNGDRGEITLDELDRLAKAASVPVTMTELAKIRTPHGGGKA